MEQLERSTQLRSFDTQAMGKICSNNQISNLKNLVDKFKKDSTNRVELDAWGNYHTDSFTRT